MASTHPTGLYYRQLTGDYAVCRLPATTRIHPHDGATFWCQLLAGRDCTVYCLSEDRPENAEAETGWALLELDGSFAFDVVGVMAAWTAPLAAAQIPLMAISSFATDYLLVKHDRLAEAHAALADAGFGLLGS